MGTETLHAPARTATARDYPRIVVPPPGEEATYYIRMQRWNAGPFDFAQVSSR